MPPDLGRHLQHDTLVRPGREAALAPELPDLAGDRQQRVGGRLVGQIVKFRSGDRQPRAAPGQLPPRDTQQQFVLHRRLGPASQQRARHDCCGGPGRLAVTGRLPIR